MRVADFILYEFNIVYLKTKWSFVVRNRSRRYVRNETTRFESYKNHYKS